MNYRFFGGTLVVFACVVYKFGEFAMIYAAKTC